MKYLPNILIVDDVEVFLALLKTMIANSIHVNLIQALSGDKIELENIKNISDKIFESFTLISNIINHVRIFSRSHDNSFVIR